MPLARAAFRIECPRGSPASTVFYTAGSSVTGTTWFEADHGAVPRTITSHGDVTNVVTELPHGSDIRAFVEMFQRQFPDAELLARSGRSRPLQTQQAFRSEPLDRLTERQQEVLRAAYFSGFFEWPRGDSGTEIAEALDISQPTFHDHLRATERKLFEMLLDDKRDRSPAPV